MTLLGVPQSKAEPAPTKQQKSEPRISEWADCTAHARKLDEHGREVVVRCDMAIHAAPNDVEEEHHDPDFGIIWRYDDDLIFDD